MAIEYRCEITAEEYNAIRKAMGWRQYHPQQAQANVAGNTLNVVAFDLGVAVAIAGLRYNGGSMAVLNLIIDPAFRGRGIEKELTDRVFAWLQAQLGPGHSVQVDTFAPLGQEDVYTEAGFQVCTGEMRGTPMYVCLSNQIEITDQMFGQMEHEGEHSGKKNSGY